MNIMFSVMKLPVRADGGWGCDIKQDVVKHEKASVTTDCKMYVAAWGIKT